MNSQEREVMDAALDALKTAKGLIEEQSRVIDMLSQRLARLAVPESPEVLYEGYRRSRPELFDQDEE